MARAVILDPLFGDGRADAVLAARETYGAHGQYSNEGFETGYAPELPQRFDAVRHFIRTQSRSDEPAALAAARTNYFRETYAYGDDVRLPGIEPFLRHDAFVEAARAIHQRSVIVPAIVFANVYLPGQSLALHTDVPEFRGANRTITPQWLLVVMHHSGLFDAWRMPIATGIAFFGQAGGGELIMYPDGPAGPRHEHRPQHDTAVVLDTDTVFHGVAPVAGDDRLVSLMRPGMQLVPDADTNARTWTLRHGDAVVGRVGSHELRFSVSWKAYCFADDTERTRWAEHRDDLGLDTILATLEHDLRARGALTTERPVPHRFAELLVEEYVHFPTE